MKSAFIKILTFSLIIICLLSCDNDPLSKYRKKEKEALAKGIRNDSLFLGYHLGMSSEDFYKLSWDNNKKGIIREGLGNMTVLYKLDTPQMHYLTFMDFYPKFHMNKIHIMPIRFFYTTWNPALEETSPAKLEQDVLKLMEKWYGKGFFVVKDPKKGRVLVKIDGNRRISILQSQERDVYVKIVDLKVVKELEAQGVEDEWWGNY
jgi:hypothetical protein